MLHRNPLFPVKEIYKHVRFAFLFFRHQKEAGCVGFHVEKLLQLVMAEEFQSVLLEFLDGPPVSLFA